MESRIHLASKDRLCRAGRQLELGSSKSQAENESKRLSLSLPLTKRPYRGKGYWEASELDVRATCKKTCLLER
jgi:hypothetical protein